LITPPGTLRRYTVRVERHDNRLVMIGWPLERLQLSLRRLCLDPANSARRAVAPNHPICQV
jgi:hypothetical protein